MKKVLLGLIVFLGLVAISEARGREGKLVKPTYKDSGDIIEATAITIGTTTVVQIFFSSATEFYNYRELMFQNTSTNSFRVYIGTHAAISASSGGRWFIPGGGSWSTNAKDDLWALFESAAHNTGTLQVLGEFERDSADSSLSQ